MFVPVEAGQVKVQEEINLRSSPTSGMEVGMLYRSVSNEMNCFTEYVIVISRLELNFQF